MLRGVRSRLARLLRRLAARVDPTARGPAVLAIDTPDELQITTIFYGDGECRKLRVLTIDPKSTQT